MKTVKIIGISLGVLFVFGIIGNLINPQPLPAPVVEKKELPWDSLEYEVKKAWIEDFLDSPDDAANQLLYMTDQSIRKHFTYPREVEYDWGSYPSFREYIIGDADSAWVFVRGSGTAKNAYGMRSEFSYMARMTIRPGVRRLDDLQVSLK